METLDLHKRNQNEFRIRSHAHGHGGKGSYQVFILSGADWSDVKGYLYATFLQHLTALNVHEADPDEQQNTYL